MEQKIDKSSGFAAQQKLAIIQLLGEIPNFIWLLISAVISKSVLVWMDLIDSTNILFRATFVVALLGKLKKICVISTTTAQARWRQLRRCAATCCCC